MEKKVEKIELQPGERCPYCGQKRRNKKTFTEKQLKASRENGKKGGRPPKNAK